MYDKKNHTGDYLFHHHVSILTLYSETFKFSYELDDRYRILSRVDEHVYINGIYSHRADILNKITVHVKDLDGEAGYIDSVFQTSERTSGTTGAYQWATEYKSEFIRDQFGRYKIAPEYFMPVVRDVPVFPDRELQPGIPGRRKPRKFTTSGKISE